MGLPSTKNKSTCAEKPKIDSNCRSRFNSNYLLQPKHKPGSHLIMRKLPS